MNFKTTTLNGIRLTVGYYMNGNHYPATRETPEENPEADIQEVTLEGDTINIVELLSEEQIDELTEKMYDY